MKAPVWRAALFCSVSIGVLVALLRWYMQWPWSGIAGVLLVGAVFVIGTIVAYSKLFKDEA
ncbi:hypothetical protein OOT46_20165 [Aquabacterium sp. A7-Y]|uniref:hypothetical protein n=1 Tax=Aquabacterium sp. A7-Y TaxID=1349605 RepID=UPI00223CD3AB|nr:hypothetical protein [Aquabacterium sp. A7-Y]MCW7540152.1 hypothetical protein [Aquabacterium sp. A7-Y]